MTRPAQRNINPRAQTQGRAAGIIAELRRRGDPDAVLGMARYGIQPAYALGVHMPVLRDLARKTGKDHHLAQALWKSGIHEARILASLVEDPGRVTKEQLERWVADFDSWDICDQCCMNLFEDMPGAPAMAHSWSKREEEFVRRAGYVLMARLAVSDREAPDAAFERFFPPILRGCSDQRVYVKKAVNWALRQIGKRSPGLNGKTVKLARRIAALPSPAARWIAADALRELQSPAIQRRFTRQGTHR